MGPARDFIRLCDILSAGQDGGLTLDSLWVDTNGNLFVALYKGGGVAIVSPTERLITAVDDDGASGYRGQIVRMADPLAP